jgi:hypothetical protein
MSRKAAGKPVAIPATEPVTETDTETETETVTETATPEPAKTVAFLMLGDMPSLSTSDYRGAQELSHVKLAGNVHKFNIDSALSTHVTKATTDDDGVVTVDTKLAGFLLTTQGKPVTIDGRNFYIVSAPVTADASGGSMVL